MVGTGAFQYYSWKLSWRNFFGNSLAIFINILKLVYPLISKSSPLGVLPKDTEVLEHMGKDANVTASYSSV